MGVVYEIAIVVWIIAVGWIIIAPSSRKPRNDYERKQREIQKRRDIEQVKAQDKYDNDWGYIK